MSSEHKAKQEGVLERVAADTWSAQEREESLARVQGRVLGVLESPVPSRRWWPQVLFGAGSLSAAVAAGWFFFLAPPASLPLETKGALAPIADKTLRYRVKPSGSALFQVSGKWQMKAGAGAELALSQPTREQAVTLSQGQLNVAVKPKTMRSFLIHTDALSVKVVGTVFSVEREQDWTRVEVYRGEVSVKTPTETVSVPAGRGLRYTSTAQTWQLYGGVPLTKDTQGHALPHTQIPPLARLRQLFREPPEQGFQLARDLSYAQRVSRTKRKALLQEAINWLRPQRKWKMIMVLKQRQIDLAIQNNEKAQALAETARICRRNHLPRSRCLSLYRRYLKLAPHKTSRLAGSQRPEALYRLAQMLHHVPGSNRAELHRLLRTYIADYPKGLYIIQARRLLVRSLLEQGQSCAQVRPLLAPLDAGSTWFQQRCKQQ